LDFCPQFFSRLLAWKFRKLGAEVPQLPQSGIRLLGITKESLVYFIIFNFG
jgi:hypothetical protein